MALDDDEKAIVKGEILGIPAIGAGFAVHQLASLFGPSGEPYDFTAVTTALDTKLAAMSSNTQTRVEACITDWLAIKAYSPLKVSEAPSGKGVLVDHEAQRRAIHATVCNLIGFWLPYGGWAALMQKNADGGEMMGGRISRG